METTLSIVTVAHNTRTVVRGLLDSIRASVASFEIETFVVDSGMDGTAAMVRAEYPEVTVLEAPEAVVVHLKLPGAEAVVAPTEPGAAEPEVLTAKKPKEGEEEE